MQLIGMMDSAFVRRVAITMHMLGIAFEHRPISVFSTYERFRAINPVVKAPTLVCDDGVQLMDSTLIIDYLEAVAGRSLMPSAIEERRAALRLIGLALVACEKTAQCVHERRLRPNETRHKPWEQRILHQLVAALEELEHALAEAPLECDATIGQAGVTVAVSWRFTQLLVPELIDPAAFPALAQYSSKAELLPAFIAAPPL